MLQAERRALGARVGPDRVPVRPRCDRVRVAHAGVECLRAVDLVAARLESAQHVVAEAGLGEDVPADGVDLPPRRVERDLHVGAVVDDVREELGVDLPEGDYETIAGFVLEKLGHIPREGEAVALDGYQIVVSEVQGRKIESVVVTKVSPA